MLPLVTKEYSIVRRCSFISQGWMANVKTVFGVVSLFLLLFTLPVASQIEADITSEPSGSVLSVEEDTKQEFRIAAIVPVPDLAFEIDYIEFYAEGAKGWNKKKKGCFGRPCYSLARAAEYEWGKTGIYSVTAKVFDTTGKVRATHGWTVAVGNQEEINQLLEDANRPRAEIKIIKAQARKIRFPAGRE